MEQRKLKEPKTFKEQLKILEDRHMKVKNDTQEIEILSQTNYYRLTAYALPFKENDDYNNKISFNSMYRLYQFDKKLRNLLLGMLETIEISLRTYVAYVLAHNFGPEAHMNKQIYKDIKKFQGFYDEKENYHKGLCDEIKIEIKKNRKELLVKHHIREYDGHFHIWAIVEIFSFGMLSKMYANLNIQSKKQIASKGFKTSYILLESYIRNFAYIRNICAHYGRLYNKKFTINPKIHNKYSQYNLDGRGLFVTILAIKELTRERLEWKTFRTELEGLIEEYIDVVDLKFIGFPENWLDILNI